MNWTKKILTIAGTAALIATSVAPAAAAADAEAPLDLQTRLTEFVGLVPGGAAALTIHDGEITTAVAGIANAAGDPVEVDTPFYISPITLPLYATLVMQLADEGLIDLDEPMATYLPDVAIDPEATVLSVLSHRAGLPNVLGTVVEMSLADPSRRWTTNELVGLVKPEDIGSPGQYNPNASTHYYTQHLIEAATGADLRTALASRITEPLGMATTERTNADTKAPSGLAAGWLPDLGLAGEASAEFESIASTDPTSSTVGDLATFMSALFEGRIISDELLGQLFDDELDIWDGHDDAFGDLGDLGGRYVLMYGGDPAGTDSAIAGDPASGNLVVVLTNNEGLDSLALVRDIVRTWAPETDIAALATQAVDGAGTVHFLTNVNCEYGQRSALDLPACVVDESGLHATMLNPGQRTGAFDGFQTLDGVVNVNPEDGTFTYSGLMVFAGTVEGCGTGTVFFEADGEGFTDANGVSTFTSNTSTAIPGGTLPLIGIIDESGAEALQGDGTAILDYSATYSCEAEAEPAA